MTKQTDQTISRLDPDGRIVVGVRLDNIQDTCWLYREDYDRVVSGYGITSWYANDNGKGALYVRLKGRHGNNLMVARLIVGDHERNNVRYLDKNPLNLRRTNLYFGAGRGGRVPDSAVRKAHSNATAPVVHAK